MKILLADDEPIARTMLEHWLAGWEYEVISAKDGRAALAALERDPSIRLAILDWVMPHLDGVDVCREVRRGREAPYVYCLLLTARDDKDDILRGLDAGADDYLVKPCNPLDLRLRLRAGTRLIALHDKVDALQQDLAVNAMNDPLTTALNLSPFLELLRREFARSKRSGEAVSIVVFSIDELAQLSSDGLGGSKERILKQSVQRFMGVVRSYDLFGTLHEGEFALVLPQCEAERGVEIAARLQYALSSTPLSIGSDAVRVTASYGVASTTQRLGTRMEQLLRSASQAMLRARSEGRNRVRLASAEEWLDSERALTASSAPAA